jgi:hypothetical protein
MTKKSLTRKQAIEFALTPVAIRNKRYELLEQSVCVVCGRDKRKEELDINRDCIITESWSRLRSGEHWMDICPQCAKNIYDKSPKPWLNN